MSITVRAGDLRNVFPFDNTNNLRPTLLRMSVLFEDLRLELSGISEDELQRLDWISRDYRQFYFLRRSMATLLEFSEAILWLEDREPNFAQISSKFDSYMHTQWGKSVGFFRRFGPLLKRIRNDMGGHYGLAAARHICEEMSAQPSLVGLIKWGEGAPTLQYVEKIVLGPMIRHVPGATVLLRTKFAVRKTKLGYQRAVRAMSVLVSADLFRRFG